MSETPRVLGGAWIDLDYAMLCLDCEVAYDLRAGAACPKCGREGGALLARFLQKRRQPAEALDVSPYVDAEQLVPLGEVLHHAGNGLSPARVQAELLVDAIELRGRIGPAFNQQLEERIARAGRRIVDSIDATMTRLRALAGATPADKEPTDAANDH